MELDQLIEKLGNMSSYFQNHLEQEKAEVTALAMVDQKDVDAINSAVGILMDIRSKQENQKKPAADKQKAKVPSAAKGGDPWWGS